MTTHIKARPRRKENPPPFSPFSSLRPNKFLKTQNTRSSKGSILYYKYHIRPYTMHSNTATVLHSFGKIAAIATKKVVSPPQ